MIFGGKVQCPYIASYIVISYVYRYVASYSAIVISSLFQRKQICDTYVTS